MERSLRKAVNLKMEEWCKRCDDQCCGAMFMKTFFKIISALLSRYLDVAD